MSRDYGQYCGLARALDVVGDRWNLLIVRQLLIAPARYRELRDGLPGVATNLLADRLRDLETAGVVERRLGHGGNAVTYALTPWGAALREPIEGLIRWSGPLMTRGPEGDVFRGEWLALALPALFGDRVSTAAPVTVGVAVDGELIAVRATPTGVVAGQPDGQALDAIITAPAPIILGLAAGMLGLADVADAVGIDGDEAAVRAIFGGRSAPVA